MTKQLIAMVESKGFALIRQKKHYIFKHPSGKILVCGKTINDRRALRNIESNIAHLLGEA
jgi:predicted RNA binding protein YcfA (HicA-like mRNA interferase family)